MVSFEEFCELYVMKTTTTAPGAVNPALRASFRFPLQFLTLRLQPELHLAF